MEVAMVPTSRNEADESSRPPFPTEVGGVEFGVVDVC